MALIDKQIKWYPVSKNKNRRATHDDKPHFMKEDIKEAITEFTIKLIFEKKLSKSKVFRILEKEFGVFK